MSNAALLEKIKSLPDPLQVQVADFVEFLLKKNQKKTTPHHTGDQVLPNKSREKLSLEAAADLMLDRYLHDDELTALTVLDSEDFYESK